MVMKKIIEKVLLMGCLMFGGSFLMAQSMTNTEMMAYYKKEISSLTPSQEAKLDKVVTNYISAQKLITENKSTSEKAMIHELSELNKQTQKELSTFLNNQQLKELEKAFTPYNPIKQYEAKVRVNEEIAFLDKIVVLTLDQKKNLLPVFIKYDKMQSEIYNSFTTNKISSEEGKKKIDSLKLNKLEEIAEYLTKEQQDRWINYQNQLEKDKIKKQ